MKPFFLVILSTIYFCSFAQTTQNNTSSIYGKLHLSKVDGIEDSLLCGSLPVYENRESDTGRIIHLNIIVIPALHRDSVGTPVFYLEGGPGVAACNNASFFADRSIPYRQYHDIVLVDVRGTGKSNPLNCSSLQIKQNLNEQFEDMYPVEAVIDCYDSLSQIADLKQYTTTHIVEDLEDIRKWLGYGKINLYALSYGNRVALVYMKMFPSAIESCILWSPVPTYASMPLYHAQFAQNSLEKIFDDCKKDSLCNNAFPNLSSEFDELMQKSKGSHFEVKYTSTGLTENYFISWDVFETKLRTLMYAPDGIRQIPYIIHEAYIGNWNPFIELYPPAVNTNNFIAEGLYLCITCTEDVPFIPVEEIDSLTKGTFMGTYRIDQQTAACSHWVRGEIPADFFTPTISEIPTLIFSGSFDPITPTSIAEEIASHLSNCQLVIISQMSHTFDGLSHPECFDAVCLSFINDPGTKKLNLDCIKEMLPDNYKIDK